MKVVHGVREAPLDIKNSMATVGNFDGLHLGHREIISGLVKAARKQGLPSVAMTFDPHPMKVLVPSKGLKNLFSMADRQERMAELGVDYMVIEPFSRKLSQLTPQDFFDELLVKGLKASELFVGHDFNFGKNRSGTQEVLKKLCDEAGIPLTVFEAVTLDGEIVSSTAVRKAVANGEVKKASRLLGRPFEIAGVVERGAGRGKKIGFPTANLYSRSEFFPKNGVYFTLAEVKGRKYGSMTNVGINPTFDPSTNRHPVQVETHILNFDEDIYGDTLKVQFLEYLREEKKFSSVEELIAQISADVERAKGYSWPT